MESKPLDFTGLKIPRDYFNWKEENKMTTIGFANVSFSVISLVMLVVDTVIKVGIASFAIKLLIDYIFRKIEQLKEK